MILSADDPTLRVMLVGNRVPPNIKKVLDHHGIAWKEITFREVRDFLEKRQDEELLALVEDEKDIELSKSSNRKSSKTSKGEHIKNVSFEEYESLIKELYNKVIKPIGKDISISKGTRYTSVFFNGARILHIYDRTPERVQVHIDKRYLTNNNISIDINALKEKFEVGDTGDDYPVYVYKDSDLDYLANFLKSVYR
jgi:CO dehydrogenase/acetyl-CoA synthase delta subunit